MLVFTFRQLFTRHNVTGHSWWSKLYKVISYRNAIGVRGTRIKGTPAETVLVKSYCTYQEVFTDKMAEADSTKITMNWDISQVIASRLYTKEWAVKNLVKLLTQGDTIPFIARYRKEMTGDMDVEKIREVKDSMEELRSVEAKVPVVMKAIQDLGKLSKDLELHLKNCQSMSEVETLYAPFKPGHKGTLAERARALGLEPLAQICLQNPANYNPEKYIQLDTKGLSTMKEVETGVQHILADIMHKDKNVIDIMKQIQCDPQVKLDVTEAKGLKKKLKDAKKPSVDKSNQKKSSIDKNKNNQQNPDNAHKYQLYFDFSLPVRYVKPHQVMAINRGEDQKILSVHCSFPSHCKPQIMSLLQRKFVSRHAPKNVYELLVRTMEDCYDRLLLPAMIRHIRADLTKTAVKSSIDVFANNLKQLLLMQPTRGKCIMGVDPGFKNGCKISIITETGKVLHTDKIFLNDHTVKSKLMEMVSKYRCDIFAIGDGHGCRETEQVFSQVIKENKLKMVYSMVNECGASIYSVTDVAKKDLPDLDCTLRSAVSIARRLQDPLAEYVKVEPKHLGVGQYQLDLPEKLLQSSLDSVVEECVSFVGVDINTASEYLLRRISGLNVTKAKKIIEWRESKGCFVNRQQIRSVKGIGEKSFEQCAGFVRVHSNSVDNEEEPKDTDDGSPVKPGKKRKATTKKTGKAKKARTDNNPNPLDMTSIHPESYPVAERLMDKMNVSPKDIGSAAFSKKVQEYHKLNSESSLAKEFDIGQPTMHLILEALKQLHTYDFREAFDKPMFRGETRSVSDLKIGTVVTGKVNNVTHFGAFIDIGVELNGLLHNSCMKGKTLQLGNKVEVKVQSMDLQRKRIGFELIRIL